MIQHWDVYELLAWERDASTKFEANHIRHVASTDTVGACEGSDAQGVLSSEGAREGAES